MNLQNNRDSVPTKGNNQICLTISPPSIKELHVPSLCYCSVETCVNLRQKIERLQNTRERERIETRLDEEKVNFRFSRKFQTVTLKAAASSFFRSKKAI